MDYRLATFKLSNCFVWAALALAACASDPADPGSSESTDQGTITSPQGTPGTSMGGAPRAGSPAVAGASGGRTTSTANAGASAPAAGTGAGVVDAGAAGSSGSLAAGSGAAGAVAVEDDAGVADEPPTDAAVPDTAMPDAAAPTEPTEPTDDGLGAKPPFEPTGMPIMAPERTWTWVPFPDAVCRSGSPAGLSVNLNPASKRVMIYLEGGGACFDAQTCAANPDAVGAQSPGNAGVFDRSRRENPVADWNYVYVPYCTGDVHMGAQRDGQVPGVNGTQQFVGRLNLTAFLHRLVPTFSDAEQVLLTGVSAGGFGAASNAAYVQWAFGPEVPLTLVDDSGPTFSAEHLPKCLTDLYVKTWGLSGSILDDCGTACSADADYSTQFLEYTLRRAGENSGGLISSDEDAVIRGFYGIGTNNGANDCMGVLLLTSMSPADFLAGLLEYRERVKAFPKMSTFYPSSTQHTWLGGDGFYTGRAGGVRLVDWFSGVLAAEPSVHAGH